MTSRRSEDRTVALNVTLYWLPASNRSSKTRSVGGARAKRGWRKSVQSGLTDLPTGSPTARGRHDGRSPPTTRGARPWPRTVWSTQSERHSPVIRNAHSPSVTVQSMDLLDLRVSWQRRQRLTSSSLGERGRQSGPTGDRAERQRAPRDRQAQSGVPAHRASLLEGQRRRAHCAAEAAEWCAGRMHAGPVRSSSPSDGCRRPR